MKELKGLYIEVRNKDIETALSKLRRLVKDSNQWLLWEKANRYIKKSDIKRDKKNRAKARQRALNGKNR